MKIEEKIKELEQKLAELQEEISQLKQQPKNQYPMKLIDLGSWNTIGAGNKFDLLKYNQFARLVETCREWNRIDGFVPDWMDSRQEKNVIICEQANLDIYSISLTQCPLYFSTHETAKLFLETFRTELESIKYLL